MLGNGTPCRALAETAALSTGASAMILAQVLDLARRIEDLRAPPTNRLEQLKGDRAGHWSLRVNDQFRICFRWT